MKPSLIFWTFFFVQINYIPRKMYKETYQFFSFQFRRRHYIKSYVLFQLAMTRSFLWQIMIRDIKDSISNFFQHSSTFSGIPYYLFIFLFFTEMIWFILEWVEFNLIFFSHRISHFLFNLSVSLNVMISVEIIN